MAKKRTTYNLLCCIEQKLIQHGKAIRTLQNHFDNHLTEHKNDLKAKLKLHWTVVIIILSALLTATGSLIVGLFLFFLK